MAPFLELVEVLIAASREEGQMAADLANAIKLRNAAPFGSIEHQRAIRLIGALRAGHEYAIKCVQRSKRAVLDRFGGAIREMSK